MISYDAVTMPVHADKGSACVTYAVAVLPVACYFAALLGALAMTSVGGEAVHAGAG